MNELCPICNKEKPNPINKTCSRACGTKLQWQDKSRLAKQSEKFSKNNPGTGRPMGSKNKNPYPMSEAVINRLKENGPPSWLNKKHTEDTLAKMSKTRLEKIASGEIVIMASYKGRFSPKNPSKYKGNPANIIYRSSWELKLMRYLDTHPDVVQWASEEYRIPYRSPVDGRVHTYFPDFWMKSASGVVTVIEVKPAVQTKEPKKQARVTKKYLREVFEYGKNQAKWKAAREYCADRGWNFEIMTEKQLGING